MALWDGLMTVVRSVLPRGDQELQEWLDQAADMGADRVRAYELYEAFYNGDKGVLLRDRARKYLEANGVPFTENFCDVVVDALSERLSVVGFTSSLAGSEEDPIGRIADEWWQRNRMDAVQVTAHTQALMRGDEYLIVEWDDRQARPRFVRQRHHQVKVVYSDDSPDEISYAAKVWNTSRLGPQNPAGRRIRRMNLYWPDRIEKWFRVDRGGDKGMWVRWQDTTETGEPEPWPLPWTTTGGEDGEPLGVPVVHLRHKALGDGDGRSRVKAAIPFQEQLNKYLADLNDLVDNHALPQDWVTGAGGTTNFKRVPGNVWHGTAPETTFGRLEASDTSNLLNAIEGVLSRLARKMRVPMHLLTGGVPPSGESLKTAESGLVATVRQCQVDFGDDWEDAMLLGLRLEAVFGDQVTLGQLDGLVLEAQWANPETRSDQDELQTALLKKQLGVSRRTLMAEMGYDPEREMEMSRAEQEMQAEAAAKMFDAGQVPA